MCLGRLWTAIGRLIEFITILFLHVRLILLLKELTFFLSSVFFIRKVKLLCVDANVTDRGSVFMSTKYVSKLKRVRCAKNRPQAQQINYEYIVRERYKYLWQYFLILFVILLLQPVLHFHFLFVPSTLTTLVAKTNNVPATSSRYH